mgnify:CR=1 FL=1
MSQKDKDIELIKDGETSGKKVVAKFDYSKIKWSKGTGLIDFFTDYNNIDFWKECGLEIARGCAIRHIYVFL